MGPSLQSGWPLHVWKSERLLRTAPLPGRGAASGRGRVGRGPGRAPLGRHSVGVCREGAREPFGAISRSFSGEKRSLRMGARAFCGGLFPGTRGGWRALTAVALESQLPGRQLLIFWKTVFNVENMCFGQTPPTT